MSTVFSAEDLPNLEGEGGGDLPKPGAGASGGDGAAGGAGGTGKDDASKQQQPFRYGDDAPEEWRGKTHEEAMALYKSVKAIGQQAMEGLRQVRAAPPVVPQTTKPEDYQITGEDLMASNAHTVNEKLDKLFTAKAGPIVTQMFQGLGQLAFGQARSNPSMPYFQKYEQEIIQLAGQQSAFAMSSPLAWEKLYKEVVGNHQQEIIELEVRKRLDESGGDKEKPTSQGGRRRAAPDSETGGRGSIKSSGEAAFTVSQEAADAARALGVDPTDKAFIEIAKRMEES